MESDKTLCLNKLNLKKKRRLKKCNQQYLMLDTMNTSMPQIRCTSTQSIKGQEKIKYWFRVESLKEWDLGKIK